MPKAFVIDGDQILCSKTATNWLPFGLALTESWLTNYRDTNKAPLSIVTLTSDLPSSTSMALSHSTQGLEDNPSISPSTTVTLAIAADLAMAHGFTLPDTATFIPYRQLIASLPLAVTQHLTQAIQLLRWQHQTRFCSRCGAVLHLQGSSNRAMICPSCKLTQYPRIQPCIITLVTRDHPQSNRPQILLAHHHRYGQPSNNPQYGLLAGFVEVGESLEQTVQREIFEEVGLSVTNIQYLGSQPWPFPSNLMVGFQADYASGNIVVETTELSHADFFDLDNLPKIPPRGSIAHHMIQRFIKSRS